MLNLDKIESLPDYQVVLGGQTLTFKTPETIEKLTSTTAKDLSTLPSLVQDVFGLKLEMHQALALLKDFDGFARQFERTLLSSTSFMADLLHFYNIPPSELKGLSPRVQLGLHSNIRRLHTLHVLEQAASIAMIFKPDLANTYIQRLKLFEDGDPETQSPKNDSTQDEDIVVKWKAGTADLHSSVGARKSLLRDLGL